LVLDRDELKKLLKEKGVKSLDDFNAFMRNISKEVVETLLEGELPYIRVGERKILFKNRHVYARPETWVANHNSEVAS
jgi:hypothetical protein